MTPECPALHVSAIYRRRGQHSPANSGFHEKAGQSQDGFVFPFCGFLFFSRAASVAEIGPNRDKCAI
jgi:hypothetical protein